jgi:uncharacterized membrane protein
MLARFRLNWLNILVLVTLLLAIALRFINLEHQVYWIDEVHTTLRAAGFTRNEFVDLAPEERIVGIEDIQYFQQLHPERNFLVGVNAIASSEHSPLYYFSARLAMEIGGSSRTVTRGVAAIISLLAFPGIYLLSLELFASPLVGLIAIALVAVSPLHLLYAREAREYSSLIVTIIWCCWAFLRAYKKPSKFNWGVYSVSLALGLYAHPLAILVVIGHGIYLSILNGLRWYKSLINYLISVTVGILLFSPWIYVFIVNGDGLGEWTSRNIGLSTLFQRWILNLCSVFFDLQVGYSDRLFDVELGKDIALDYGNPVTYLIFPVLLLIVYAFYYLIRHTPRPTWLFVVLLTTFTATVLALPDAIDGGQRSSVARYMVAVYLGFQLAVAYCLGDRVLAIRVKVQTLWRIVTVIVISLGLWCCLQIVAAPTWWNKYSSYYNAGVAEIVNEYPNPLIIGHSSRISRVTSLSYLLDRETKFILLERDADLPTANLMGFENIFLFRPYPELIERAGERIQPLYPKGHLWQVVSYKP